MPSHELIQNLFGRFQNLNLLVLIESLRQGQTAKEGWSSSDRLCPVAHGMPEGRLVQEAQYLSQADDLLAACRYSARQLGANQYDLQRFIDWWDSGREGAEDWLLERLESIWQERLQDAIAVQELLEQSAETRGRSDEQESSYGSAS